MRTATLIGFLGRDPDIKQTNNGRSYTTFSMATKIRKDEDPVWVKVIIWEDKRTMFPILNYLKKGSSIIVMGEFVLSAYLSKSGEPKADIKVNPFYITFAPSEKKPDSNEENNEKEEVPF